MKKQRHYISEFSHLLSEWDWMKNTLLDPQRIPSGSNKKVWWKCNVCQNEWKASPNSRSRGYGCPKCGTKRATENRIVAYVSKVGSLADLHPNLLEEWCYELNEVSPNAVASQCNKKAWWKCKDCGNIWQAVIQSRTKYGIGCPECGKKLAIKNREIKKLQKGSLEQTHPYILKEWDFDRNEITPNSITSHYSKKVHWICVKGHQWQAPVNRRIRLGIGCPICAKEGGTSFAEQTLYYYINSIISSENRYIHNGFEIDIFIPSLNVGIEYDGLYYHKSEKAFTKEKKKMEALAKDGIRLIRVKESTEFKVVGDVIYTIYSSDYQYLKGAIEKIFSLLSIDKKLDFDINRDRIEILEQYIIKEKAISIVTLHPLIASQWDYEKNGTIKPEYIRGSSNLKFWWKCEQGHSWQAPVYSRVNGNGCPLCAGKTLVVGENDLLSQNPTLAKEWNYSKNGDLTPDSITIRNGNKVWWVCLQCGNEWQSTVAHRSEGKGCPICGRIKSDASRTVNIIKKRGSFVDIKPELLEEWCYDKNEGVNPLLCSKSSGKKVWWKCKKCGHHWQAIIANRVSKGSGCPICKKELLAVVQTRTAMKKTGPITLTHPHLLEEWDYVKNTIRPEDISIGSDRKVWWKCRICGYEWEAAPNSSNRKRGYEKGCPACQRKVIWIGHNDLVTTNPLLASEWNYSKNNGLDPTTITDGSNKKVWWKCSKCGYEWDAVVEKRNRDLCKCPECNKK